MVEESLAALGIDAKVEGDHAVTSVGEIPLAPVAAELDGHDRRDWQCIVDELVTRMVRSLLEGATRLTDATLAEHVVVKILGDRERAGRSFDYARPLISTVTGAQVPGLVVALAWFDDEVELLNDAALAEIDDLDSAYRRGSQRLATVLAEDLGVTREGNIVTVTGSSWLVSSWPLAAGAGQPIVDELGHDVLVGIESPDTVLVTAIGHAPELDSALSPSRIADPFAWHIG
ncbi:hypothetical protein O6R08_08155 [Cutibacterium equinum]|uniref:Uncharacterized protein n=1 Tax=Cutibacterium equinum TaxID=3016342 RepID=A0ABY7R2P8_9ACTN|nr:hypothetical protein [Cutibacterium equinum]WCC81147.1 hypothetical protein O6R08_08155 [Cutibacterium equinum]